MVDATVSVANTNQHQTALEHLQEDPHMMATAVGAVAGAAVAAVPPTAAIEELVAEETAEPEATRTATPPAIHK
jgi:hypothetical protein